MDFWVWVWYKLKKIETILCLQLTCLVLHGQSIKIDKWKKLWINEFNNYNVSFANTYTYSLCVVLIISLEATGEDQMPYLENKAHKTKQVNYF